MDALASGALSLDTPGTIQKRFAFCRAAIPPSARESIVDVRKWLAGVVQCEGTLCVVNRFRTMIE